MNSEEFKNMTGGIQSVVFSLGLICAGAWAIYEFYTDKYETLDIKLSLSQIEISENDKYIIAADLILKNVGHKKVTVPLGENSLTATNILFDHNGTINQNVKTVSTRAYTFSPTGETIYFDAIDLSPEGDSSVQFFLSLDSPGLYFVEFKSHDVRRDIWWVATSYISVN